jgi:peptide-methionine (R)-S-oxide reductase
MRRREFIATAVGAATLALLPRALTGAGTRVPEYHPVSRRSWDLGPLARDPEFWRDYVNEDAWRVLFLERTELSGSSPFNNEWRDGTYLCAACFLPLFSSDAKYESGTGWPSFYQPFADHLGKKWDFKIVLPRRAYHCIRCGGHQGHVFNDGPKPTGQRWCNNGLALRFVPAEEALPELRG